MVVEEGVIASRELTKIEIEEATLPLKEEKYSTAGNHCYERQYHRNTEERNFSQR